MTVEKRRDDAAEIMILILKSVEATDVFLTCCCCQIGKTVASEWSDVQFYPFYTSSSPQCSASLSFGVTLSVPFGGLEPAFDEKKRSFAKHFLFTLFPFPWLLFPLFRSFLLPKRDFNPSYLHRKGPIERRERDKQRKESMGSIHLESANVDTQTT